MFVDDPVPISFFVEANENQLTGYTDIMKYLGIDYGMNRIGVAVSDERGAFAFPRAVLPNDRHLLTALATLIEQDSIETVVIGDTRSFGGAENPITKGAETFISALSQAIKIPVTPVFEGWSSMEAARYAPKKEQHNDAAAAAIILQRYLDMKGDRVE